MEEIKPLTNTGFDSIYTARNDAFSDYVKQWTKSEFEKRIYRIGYVPELSFGAFDGQQLVSFTLNGIGLFDGSKTAYDTSTGTIKAYQGKGLATKIFHKSVPALKQAGISKYLLEVLQQNTKAVSVYTSIGFRINREFNYFVQQVDALQLKTKKLPGQFVIRETDLNNKERMMKMWDFVPSWQNNFDAISRKPEDFKIIGAFDGNKLTGYGIIEPDSGDIPQIAVDKAYRRKGIGSGILKELLKYNNYTSVKVINTDTACEAITLFLENNGIPKIGAQFEMIKDI